jgi:hypothetical protein
MPKRIKFEKDTKVGGFTFDGEPKSKEWEVYEKAG